MKSLSLAGAFALMLTAGALATEVPYAELPEAIRTGFEEHQPGVHPAQAKMETRAGQTVFVFDDIEHQDVLSEDGQIMQCIHPTATANLPESAHALLSRVFGDHEVVGVEGVYTHTDMGLVTDYLVTCRHGGEDHTVLVSGAMQGM